jgi:hypothetical protein
VKGLILAIAGAALLGGCATPTPRPGMGWSRAPDLSVYSAMTLFGGVARTESSLCGGFSPVTVEDVWQEDFAAREQAVAAALVARHGAEAVESAEAAAVATRRTTCPPVPTLRWREEYARLLHLLEMRLGLA